MRARSHGAVSPRRQPDGVKPDGSPAEDPVHAAFDAYVDWLLRCESLEKAYRRWRTCDRAGAGRAHRAYARMLELEELAAESYARALRKVAHGDERELALRLAVVRAWL